MTARKRLNKIRPERISMDDDIFEVGLPISIETDYKYYLTTNLIGWQRDVFLITDFVPSAGKSGHLKINDRCKMRFLKDGIAYGFETKIISISAHPFPVMFLTYPGEIEHFAIRKFNRIKSNFQAHFLDERGTYIADATITNISAGGCGLNIPAQEAGELTSKNSYKIKFSILDTDMCLGCAIRKMRTVKGTSCLGVEFSNISPAEKEKINLFLDICTNILTSKTDMILSKLKASGETLGGQLDELLLPDILQMFDQLKKEGVLNITAGSRKGFITLSDGRIMDATLDNLQGEDALVECLTLKEGGFQFFAKAIASGRIKRPISFVLMDTYRLIDERDSLRDYFPGIKDTLILVKEPDRDDAEIQAVVNAFRGGASNVSELNTATGMSFIRSGLAAARLLKEGFLIKVQ